MSIFTIAGVIIYLWLCFSMGVIYTLAGCAAVTYKRDKVVAACHAYKTGGWTWYGGGFCKIKCAPHVKKYEWYHVLMPWMWRYKAWVNDDEYELIKPYLTERRRSKHVSHIMSQLKRWI